MATVTVTAEPATVLLARSLPVTANVADSEEEEVDEDDDDDVVHHRDIHIFNLPINDVLVHSIVSKLSISECFKLRCVSKLFKKIVESYFEEMKSVNLTVYRDFNIKTFEVLIKHCRNVHYLYLSKCTWITNKSLIRFLRMNRHLRAITLNYCTQLGPEIFDALIGSCKELHTLYLVKCTWITPEVIDALTDSDLLWLRSVDFSYCSKLTEQCIVRFVTKFEQIEFLSLAYISLVSNAVMEVIARHLIKLKHLNIAGCSVTYIGLKSVLDNCKELTSLVAARRSFNEETLKYASVQIRVGFAPEQYFSETCLIKQPPRKIIPDIKKSHKMGIVNRLRILREKL